jgi:cytochrome c1
LRKKTFKELKKIIKDKEILDIIGAFYYKGFMDNFSSTSEEKQEAITKFMKQIAKREAN